MQRFRSVQRLAAGALCLLVGTLGCRSELPAPVPAQNTAFAPAPDSADIPEGMLFVPGGVTAIGSDDGFPTEEPVFEARVASFLIDKSPVTVADFRAFVEATGFLTEAEKFGNAGVFDRETQQWTLKDGATWHHPLGPDESAAPDDHPVTQVSWHDAAAYAAWAGKRLPTEVEWEHAARGAANRRDRYAWGTELAEDGVYHANTWNGTFPAYDTGADGYPLTSPVGAFGATPLGLTDMGGNVWEWTDSWFRPYAERSAPFTPTPASERVQRGGSFLCEPGWCHGYRVSARSHATPETSLYHVGFRCVRDV